MLLKSLILRSVLSASASRELHSLVVNYKLIWHKVGKQACSWAVANFAGAAGSRRYFGALMLGVCDQGKLCYVGNTGTGFSDGQLKDILKQLTPHFTDTLSIQPKT
jgi:hypothetical protein